MKLRSLCLLISILLPSPTLLRAQFVLTKVADTATPIPNGSGNFTAFNAGGYGPAMSQGSVVFYASGANGQRGYYSHIGGVLSRLADTNTTAPGGSKFTGFGTFSYGFESESLYFNGGSATESGFYVSSNGIITKLMDTNTVAPPGPNKLTSFLLAQPYDRRIAFLGSYGATTSQRGIYLYDQGVITRLVDGSANFPGSAGLAFNIANAGDISHDAGGAVAFFATDTNAAPPIANGILTFANGSLHLIASTATQAPGTANLFTGFRRRADISGGKVVFTGTHSGGGGLYQANLDGSGLTKLVDTTTPVPGGTGNFLTFQDSAIELGTVVFTTQGAGITGGAAYRLQNGTLQKIIGKPDALDGKTVDTVVLSNQGLSGGRVALQIGFSNGSAGIYTAIVGYASQPNPGGTLVPGSVIYSSANGFSFTFIGEAGRAYRIQYSTNLAAGNWTTLTNFTYSSPLTIQDAGAVSSAGRVYRAVSP